ncbi:MAG: sulfatase-like hydrolase/transferase [Planctomycetota bacterium]
MARNTPAPWFALALLIASCGSKEPAWKGPKHILLVSLDTLRADHLGAYGNTRGLTPTMDALARQGVVFPETMAPAPTTLVSHTSMMTGRYPQNHGVVRNGFSVNADNQTLAESLAARGFHTAAFLGSFALDARFGLDQGFHVYNHDFDSLVQRGRDQNQRSAEAVTESALEYLKGLESAPEHLLLFVHYFDAHLPYEPPAKRCAACAAEPRADDGRHASRRSSRRNTRRSMGSIPSRGLRHGG